MMHATVRNVLSARAMLASVSIGQWSARKLDRSATDQTIQANNAAADAGRFNKALVDKASLARVQAAASAARNFYYARTLPWLDDGARILSADAFSAYSNEMRRYKAEFEAAADDFARDYSSAVDAARARLGAMFNPNDYPPAAEIRAKFKFATRILPVPDAQDFRVDMADAQAAEIRAALEDGAREAMEAAQRDVFKRISEAVGHVATRLAEYQPGQPGQRAQGTFKDSLIENVRELASILPTLNIAGDPRLAEISARVAGLCTMGPDEITAADLRDSDAIRARTQKAAAEIMADISGFIA